jgi:ChpA-C
MTAEKGLFMRKCAAVVAGALLAMSMAAPALADAGAEGQAVGSPGILSGNVVQIPIDIDLNVCGNSVNVVGLLNPAVGNVCIND